MQLERNLERLRSAEIRSDIKTLNALTPLFQTIVETILLLEKTKHSAESKAGISTLKVLYSDLLGIALDANSIGFKDESTLHDLNKRVHIISILADMTATHP